MSRQALSFFCKFIVIFVLVSTAAQATPESAATCPTIQVDTSNMPDNVDQDSFQWCHAWAATSLLSFYAKEKLSPYDVAAQRLSQIEDMEDFRKAASSLRDTINSSVQSKYGICKEKSAEYADKDLSELNDLYFASFDHRKLSQFKSYCRNREDQMALGLHQDVLALLGRINHKGQRFKAFLELKCRERIQIPKLEATAVYFEKPEPRLLESRVDPILKQKLPVGISIQGKLFINSAGEDYVGQKLDHFVLLVGQKFNAEKNRCEYLVRNSWGKTICEKIKTIPKKSHFECDADGNFWIPKTTIGNNIFGMTEIELKKTRGAP